MSLDARTLVLFATLIGIVLAVAMLVLRRGLPVSVKGVTAWAIAMLLQAGGALAVGLRSLLPDPMLLPLGNTLVVGGYLMQFVAVMRYLDRPYRTEPLWAALAAVYATTLWFTAGVDSFPARTTAFGSVSAAVLCIVAFELFRGAPDRSVATRFTAFVLTAIAVVMVARVAYTLSLGRDARTLFSGDPVQLGFVATFVALGIGSAMGFMLMIAEKLRSELARLATLDPLTGVYNRRTFADLAGREISRASRLGTELALVMIDLDHFKSVNDRFGHAAGDDVLREFVAIARRGLRRPDLIGRYGGEEFCILLPDTSRLEAVQVAQRLRGAVEHAEVMVRDAATRFTVSVGIAHSDRTGLDLDTLLREADLALYRAKSLGRNQVVSEPAPAWLAHSAAT
jgi:diguanylate cyclase (GGDEF)-like protein